MLTLCRQKIHWRSWIHFYAKSFWHIHSWTNFDENLYVYKVWRHKIFINFFVMERFCSFFSFLTFQLNYNIDLCSYRQLLFLFVVFTNLSNSTLSNIYPNNYLYIHLSRFYLSNILAVHLSINSSISLFIYPSISPSLYISIHSYLHLSQSKYSLIHLSILP